MVGGDEGQLERLMLFGLIVREWVGKAVGEAGEVAGWGCLQGGLVKR